MQPGSSARGWLVGGRVSSSIFPFSSPPGWSRIPIHSPTLPLVLSLAHIAPCSKAKPRLHARTLLPRLFAWDQRQGEKNREGVREIECCLRVSSTGKPWPKPMGRRQSHDLIRPKGLFFLTFVERRRGLVSATDGHFFECRPLFTRVNIPNYLPIKIP